MDLNKRSPAGTGSCHRCIVHGATWSDRRDRYAVATWCRENLTEGGWEIQAAADGTMLIGTPDPGDHALATLVWG